MRMSVMAQGCGVSFWSNENFLKLTGGLWWMHRSVHTQAWNCVSRMGNLCGMWILAIKREEKIN
jgi:hypothetical protein